MGNRFSLPLDVQEIKELTDDTHFNVKQLNSFYNRFTKLSRGKTYITQDDCLRIPELSINPLCDRIVHAFFTEERDTMSFQDFVRQLAVFKRSRHDSQREAKIRFLYNMFDLNADGGITVPEMSAFLTLLIGDSIPPEQVASIALRCVTEADEDEDHRITFEEFKKALEAVEIEQKMNIAALAN